MKKLITLILLLLPLISSAQLNLRTDTLTAFKKLAAGDSGKASNGNFYIYNGTSHKYLLFQYPDTYNGNQRIDWIHENNRDTAATWADVRQLITATYPSGVIIVDSLNTISPVLINPLELNTDKGVSVFIRNNNNYGAGINIEGRDLYGSTGLNTNPIISYDYGCNNSLVIANRAGTTWTTKSMIVISDLCDGFNPSTAMDIPSDGEHGAILFYTNTADTGSVLRLRVGNSARDAVTVYGDFIMAQSRTPSSSSSTGTTGDMVWDASYIYICIATNTWKRSAITTW